MTTSLWLRQLVFFFIPQDVIACLITTRKAGKLVMCWLHTHPSTWSSLFSVLYAFITLDWAVSLSLRHLVNVVIRQHNWNHPEPSQKSCQVKLVIVATATFCFLHLQRLKISHCHTRGCADIQCNGATLRVIMLLCMGTIIGTTYRNYL